jgi:acyl dehydratase
MGIPLWALRHQGANIRAILKVIFSGKSETIDTPGPVLSEVIDPRAPALIKAFKAWCNDPSADEVLPDHFCPQWAFPLLGQALGGSPYPMSKVLNQGFALTRNQALPANAPLNLSAQLVSVEETPGKARLSTRVITGTEAHAEAVICDVFSVVPLPRPKGEKKPRTERAEDTKVWRAVDHYTAGRLGGAVYCCLSGDINPLHWLPPFAWAAGMKNPILHGFAAGSLVTASLDRLPDHTGGAVGHLDMRFIRPMVLPAKLTLELAEDESGQHLRVVDAKGKPCVVGTFRV